MPRPFYTRLRFVLPVACLALAGGGIMLGQGSLLGPAMAAQQAGAETGLLSILARGRAGNVRFIDPPALKAFYEERGGDLAWVQGMAGYQRRASDILKILEDSWTHGLNPADYHVVEIRGALENSDMMTRDELDVVLSDAILRYGRDLTGARISLLPGIKKRDRYWRAAPTSLDILTHVTKTSSIKNALRGLEPEGKLYSALREALVDIVDEPDVPVQKIPVGGIIRPGDTSPRIPAIRARMGLPGDSRVYDETLARRVMAFQETRGVAPDAVIGGETVKLMNATRQDRINQILANLERLRWIDQDKPSRYILVNIPSATLWAVEEGDTILQMPVVVGKVKRPTIAFRTDVTGVRFNPNWTVPPTIKNEDFLPALQEDPLYLSKRGIEITTGFGRESQTIDPTTVDWADMTTEDLKGLNMIQSPGTTNPLGRVRVIMPNGYNIYLHDTNAPEYLQRSNRTLSSGCIRVAEPVKLADFILKDKAGWDQTRTDKVLESARMTEVMTDVKLPVYILYQTVWQDERGGIIFGPDVYGEDAVIAAQLRARGAIHIPGTPEKSVKSAGYSGKTALAKGGINP